MGSSHHAVGSVHYDPNTIRAIGHGQQLVLWNHWTKEVRLAFPDDPLGLVRLETNNTWPWAPPVFRHVCVRRPPYFFPCVASFNLHSYPWIKLNFGHPSEFPHQLRFRFSGNRGLAKPKCFITNTVLREMGTHVYCIFWSRDKKNLPTPHICIYINQRNN